MSFVQRVLSLAGSSIILLALCCLGKEICTLLTNFNTQNRILYKISFLKYF